MGNQGIDYSGTGAACNRDAETGIRYGVISTHSLPEWFWNSVDNDYGEPTCPECGNPVIDSCDATIQAADWAQEQNGEWACDSCEKLFDSEQVYSEEPLGWSIDEDGYQVINCLDSDAMLCKSPYYTFARFCSPCVPGACNLDSPMSEPDGVKCYCFGHDWFDGDRAPYPVYSVLTGELVEPEAKG